MNKNQREFLRIKLAEITRRLENECGEYLDKKQPREVTEALDLIQTWNEAKSESRATFREELYTLCDKAKEAILFGTKAEFDKWFQIIEGLSMPAIMVDRKLPRGKR